MKIFNLAIITAMFLCGICFGQYSSEWSSGNLGSGGYGGAYGYDIDNDNLVEFYVRSTEQLTFYNGNYTIAWNISFPGYDYVSVIQPRDIDGDGLVIPLNFDNDGTPEIMIVGYYYDQNLYNYYGRFRIYDANSHALEFESPTITGFYGTASLEDLDNDGRQEIILVRFGSSTSSSYVDVYAYSGSGSDEGTSYEVRQQLCVEPTIAKRTFDIEYTLDPAQLDLPITIMISDQTGCQVRTFNVTRPVNSGVHHLVWNCMDDQRRPVPAGIYFAMVKIGDMQLAKKMLVIR